MSRKRMAKCLALCALALAVCVGIAAALVISKNRQRAAEAAAAAAEVKRTYAYSTPSASIPVPGLGGGLRAVAHRLPLRVGCRRSERIRLLRIGDVGIRSSGYFGAPIRPSRCTMPPPRVCRSPKRNPAMCCGSATATGTTDMLASPAMPGARTTFSPHVWRARARYRSAELGRVYACAPIRIRRRTK